MTQTPVGPSAGFLAGYRAHSLGLWWWLQFWKFCKNIFPYKRICIRVWMCSLCHLSPFGTAWFPVVRHKIQKPQPSILGPSAALLVLLSFHEFHKPHFLLPLKLIYLPCPGITLLPLSYTFLMLFALARMSARPHHPIKPSSLLVLGLCFFTQPHLALMYNTVLECSCSVESADSQFSRLVCGNFFTTWADHLTSQSIFPNLKNGPCSTCPADFLCLLRSNVH